MILRQAQDKEERRGPEERRLIYNRKKIIYAQKLF